MCLIRIERIFCFARQYILPYIDTICACAGLIVSIFTLLKAKSIKTILDDQRKKQNIQKNKSQYYDELKKLEVQLRHNYSRDAIFSLDAVLSEIEIGCYIGDKKLIPKIRKTLLKEPFCYADISRDLNDLISEIKWEA